MGARSWRSGPAALSSAKSPRSAFSAYRSSSISDCVLTPSRRNRGSGGHHPCTACCSKNVATTAGKANNRRSTNAPKPSPTSATVAAFASRVRSMSHSWSSSCSRRSILSALAERYRATRASVCRRISSFTSGAVLAGTRSTVVGNMVKFSKGGPNSRVFSPHNNVANARSIAPIGLQSFTLVYCESGLLPASANPVGSEAIHVPGRPRGTHRAVPSIHERTSGAPALELADCRGAARKPYAAAFPLAS
jgi:hypothetical protein